MAAYNVFLANLGNALTQEQRDQVRTTLQGWFGQIANTDGAMVQWVTSAPTISDHELLIYFVPSEMNSVARSLPGYSGSAGSGDGFTVWAGNLSTSEVYVSRSRGWLAEIAFHECLHNKLHLGDRDLHALDGLARVPVVAGSQPSANNITRMRRALTNRHTQWTGGWGAYSDPLAELGL
ncbi:MAG: hypothetical protein U0Y68_24185 [Blastocatellia bacterium]